MPDRHSQSRAHYLRRGVLQVRSLTFASYAMEREFNSRQTIRKLRSIFTRIHNISQEALWSLEDADAYYKDVPVIEPDSMHGIYLK